MHKRPFRTLDTWFSSYQGTAVAHAFVQAFQPLTQPTQHDIVLQLGGCNGRLQAPAASVKDYWLISPEWISEVDCLTHYHQLPFDRRAVNRIIVPLTTHLAPDLTLFVDEIDRVLCPSGDLVFLGVHPWGFWGRWLKKKGLEGRPYSLASLKQALIARGYLITHLTSFYYIPPLSSSTWVQASQLLNTLGEVFTLLPPGFYCLVAQKQSIEPQIVRPSRLQSWLTWETPAQCLR